jgi:hypothetical protein
MLRDLFGHSRIEEPIERIKSLAPSQSYYGAFSGSKDSGVVKKLEETAAVEAQLICVIRQYEILLDRILSFW